jgi:protoporphyrinogen oxidase
LTLTALDYGAICGAGMTPENGHFDVIVLGAGVSGLTAAHDLRLQGLNVLILENYPTAGGNHLSKNFAGLTFDAGAIFFWSDSSFLKMFPGVVELWEPVSFSAQRITPNGGVRSYPIDIKNEVLYRSIGYQIRICASIIYQRLYCDSKKSAVDFAMHYLGSRLLIDTGLLFYMERFYGLPADAISFDFATERMRWIRDNGSVRNFLKKEIKACLQALHISAAPAPIRCYARPRVGFDKMYRYITQQLGENGVQTVLDADLRSIRRRDHIFSISTAKGEFTSERVINTMPLGIVIKLFGDNELTSPRSSILSTLCIRFCGKRGFSALVLYNFRKEGLWKRLTMHSDYYGKASDSEFLSVECTSLDVVQEAAFLFADFKKTTADVGLFNGELELVGHFDTYFAYPVHDDGAARKRCESLEKLSAFGIESIGRQGRFQYIPSASEAVDLARTALRG